MKKRSPTKTIEEGDKKVENAYIKFPNKEMIPLGSQAQEGEIQIDSNLLRNLYRQAGKKPYSIRHTHVYDPAIPPSERRKMGRPLPSSLDLRAFLDDDNQRSMTIAQRNIENGKVEGYFILRKTKNTPQSGLSHAYDAVDFRREYFSGGLIQGIKKIARTITQLSRIKKTSDNWRELEVSSARRKELEPLALGIRKIAQEYRLRYRFVPAEGYTIEDSRIGFEETKKPLESRLVLTIAFIVFIIGIFYLGLSLTGNIVSDYETNSSIGFVLLFVSLIGILLYLTKNRNI